MKVSDDQNTITLDDGTILVAKPTTPSPEACFMCYFGDTYSCCDDVPCVCWERVAVDDVIFVQKV